MFNKNYKPLNFELKTDDLYQENGIYLSKTFIDMMDKTNQARQMEEKNEYQNNIISYLNKKHENSVKKQYNPKIVSLYNEGKLVINGKEYNLKDFFIVFNDQLNNFHLKCIDQSFESEEIEYNKAVRFIDTTAFIKLINTGKIVFNKLIIDNLDILTNIIKNWDGYLHSETLETDAIMNKKMIRDDKDE